MWKANQAEWKKNWLKCCLSLQTFRLTYAGGIGSKEQIEKFAEISQGNLDFTIGSALDLFGGKLSYDEIVEEYNK